MAFGSVWVRSEEAETLSRIDPLTGQVATTIDVGPAEGRDGLDQFGVDASGLWLSGLHLTHVSAVTNRPDRVLALDGVALAYTPGTIWAAGLLGTLTRVKI